MTAKSRFELALAASCGAVTVFAAFLWATSGTPLAKRTSDVVVAVGALVAAWTCARASRRGRPDSRGWRLIAVGALVWFGGMVIWAIYGVTRDFAYPFPSVADLAFVGYSIPIALGLLRFPRQRERLVSRLRTGLDAVLIATSVLFISWATVLGPLYRSPSDGLASRVIVLGYPVADIAVASLVLALGMRRPAGGRLPWVFLGGGLVTLTVNDSIYLIRTVHGVTTWGTVFGAGWFLAFLLIALAPLVPVRSTADSAQTRLGHVEEFLPYLPFLGAVVVAAGRKMSVGNDPFLVWSGAVWLATFGVRQVMIVTENLALRDDLQARVDERTAELHQARDAALEASSSKSDFLATVSHEIRTPMNGVVCLTGLLLDSELTDGQRHHAEGVRASARSLLTMIDDLLDFSKIEAGKLELDEVDFDLAAVIEEVAALVAGSAEAKGLSVVAACHGDGPTVLRGDAGRLRQILVNLAGNAVKFTPAGEVGLRAGVRVEPAAGRAMVRVEVTDTGIGVDSVTADRLFLPFSQADASTTRRFGGTGLGLAICRRLADAMGGTIGLESQVGVGSTFWVCLPFELASTPVPASVAVAPHSSSSSVAPVAAGCRGRLLVVEDHVLNQEAARGMLAQLQYACDVVGNGGEALAALECRSYDAVLMDCHMPEVDGFQATAAIRRREAGRRHVPIIAMTAAAQAADRRRCMDAGMDDYLPKPVDAQDLGRILSRWVGSTLDPELPVPVPGPPCDGALDVARFEGLRRSTATRGETGLLQGLVDQYLVQAASQLRQLREAGEQGDAPALRAVAHRLKGASATIGATGMAAVCAAVEQAAARGEVPGVGWLEKAESELARATASLRAQFPQQS